MAKPKHPMRSKRYEDTVNALSRAIAVWFETHPGTDPQFKFPPPGTVVSGDLNLGPDWWEANADARALVTWVDLATGNQASMLQFQVCYAHYQQQRRPSA